MANKILTVSELAEHLNVHRITIYRLLKNGNLPGFKIGRVWRFELDEITAWMASGKSARGTIATDAVAQADGHAQRDGPPKAARAQSSSQPPARTLPKQTRGANTPRR
jgi:excisionase family DNA binding protein